jgi:hypothetical protein
MPTVLLEMAANSLDSPSPMVLSKEGAELQAKVWAQLVQQLEKIQPGISNSI